MSTPCYVFGYQKSSRQRVSPEGGPRPTSGRISRFRKPSYKIPGSIGSDSDHQVPGEPPMKSFPMTSPSYLEIHGGRIDLVAKKPPLPPSAVAHQHGGDWRKDKAAMEQRIADLEGRLKSLQERLQPPLQDLVGRDKSLEEKLCSVQRAAKHQERIAMQLIKEQRAATAAQEARSMQQEAALQRLRQENRVLRLQSRQYEKILDEVGRRVVAALLEQKSLREEVVELKARSRDLETRNSTLTAMLTPSAPPPAAHTVPKSSPRDEGYSTMSSDIAGDFYRSCKAPGDLEDLIEEPENPCCTTTRHSLPGYNQRTVGAGLQRKPFRSKSDSQINKIKSERINRSSVLPRLNDSWSIEELGAGLEEDCSEMLWNDASFLNHSLSRTSSNLLTSITNFNSNDTLFEHFNGNLDMTNINSLPSIVSSSATSVNSEAGAVGRDFTKDFYTLVRFESSKSVEESNNLDGAVEYVVPDEVVCSDCTSSGSTDDESWLQEVLSACGALGNHSKSAWVSIKPNMDSQTRITLLECATSSSSDSEIEIFEINGDSEPEVFEASGD